MYPQSMFKAFSFHLRIFNFIAEEKTVYCMDMFLLMFKV